MGSESISFSFGIFPIFKTNLKHKNQLITIHIDQAVSLSLTLLTKYGRSDNETPLGNYIVNVGVQNVLAHGTHTSDNPKRRPGCQDMCITPDGGIEVI